MSRAEAHLGVSPAAPSQDEPTLTLEKVGQSSHANFKMSKLAHFVEVSMVMVPWGSPHVRAAVMDVVRMNHVRESDLLLNQTLLLEKSFSNELLRSRKCNWFWNVLWRHSEKPLPTLLVDIHGKERQQLGAKVLEMDHAPLSQAIFFLISLQSSDNFFCRSF